MAICEGLDSTLQMTRYLDAENARKVYIRIFPVLAADRAYKMFSAQEGEGLAVTCSSARM